MIRVLPFIILGLLMIYCLVEVLQADSAMVRRAPKWLWAAAVIMLPGIGALAWLILGRPQGLQLPQPKSKPIAPDDDPDFLRGLR